MKKTKRDPQVYLNDILSAIERIATYSKAGKKRFFAEGLLQDAIVRQLSIVGEAASKLSKATKDMAPDIPWKEIVGTRNIVIHDYSDINLDTIWATVKKDLPTLRRAVRQIIMKSQGKD